MAAVTIDTAVARERLAHLIETLDNDRVLAMYTLFLDKMGEDEVEYTNEVKARISSVREDYANGRMENFITEKQFKHRLKQLRSVK